MDHWFIRAIPWIVRAVQFVIWACGGWVVASAPWRGEPLSVVAFYGLAGFAVTAMASYYALKIGEWIEERATFVQLGRRFAAALEDRQSVRETSMTTARAAAFWMEIDPSANPAHNTRFRWIKNAMDNGHVHGARLNANGDANKDTVLQVGDLAAFFRRRNWRKMVIGG
jgi:hypothetical protein